MPLSCVYVSCASMPGLPFLVLTLLEPMQILSPYRISLCILIHESNVARRLNKIEAASSDSVSQYLLAKINVCLPCPPHDRPQAQTAPLVTDSDSPFMLVGVQLVRMFAARCPLHRSEGATQRLAWCTDLCHVISLNSDKRSPLVCGCANLQHATVFVQAVDTTSEPTLYEMALDLNESFTEQKIGKKLQVTLIEALEVWCIWACSRCEIVYHYQHGAHNRNKQHHECVTSWSWKHFACARSR